MRSDDRSPPSKACSRSRLTLDEATTALDPGTEAEICRTPVKLKEEVTILVISHQMAMRDVADVV